MGNNPADCGLQAQGKAARMLSAHTAEQTDSSGQRFKNHDRELRKSLPSFYRRDRCCQITPPDAWTGSLRSCSPSSSAARKSNNQCRGEEVVLSLQNVRTCIFLASIDKSSGRMSLHTGNSPKWPQFPRGFPCFHHLTTRKTKLLAQHSSKTQSIMSRIC